MDRCDRPDGLGALFESACAEKREEGGQTAEAIRENKISRLRPRRAPVTAFRFVYSGNFMNDTSVAIIDMAYRPLQDMCQSQVQPAPNFAKPA